MIPGVGVAESPAHSRVQPQSCNGQKLHGHAKLGMSAVLGNRGDLSGIVVAMLETVDNRLGHAKIAPSRRRHHSRLV